MPWAAERWSAAAEDIRAINEGETEDFCDALLTARSWASARARLTSARHPIRITDNEQRQLLLKYPLEDAVCWTLERDSVLHRIWAVWSRRRSEIPRLLDTDNLQPTALKSQ